jgi:hypothetical protein
VNTTGATNGMAKAVASQGFSNLAGTMGETA